MYIPGTYVPSIKPAMDAILMILPPFLPLDTDIFSIARNTPRQTPFNMTSRHGSHAFWDPIPALFTNKVTLKKQIREQTHLRQKGTIDTIFGMYLVR